MNTEIQKNKTTPKHNPSPAPKGKNPKIEFDEFKDFLQIELGSAAADSPRRVVALSEGLGLESPKKADGTLKTELAEGLPMDTNWEVPKSKPPTPPPMRKGIPLSPDDLVKMPVETSERAKSRLAFVMDNPPPRPEEIPSRSEARFDARPLGIERTETAPITTPPALPSASAFRRLLATILDEVFVWLVYMVTLVVTVNLAKGFEPGFSLSVFQHISEPALLRVATLEFILVWLGYFAITVGLSNRTFGMWVWGLRVSYGNRSDENYALRKLMRVFWSIVFFAPAVLLPLLALRRNGRNILDTLSGSNLYGSPA